MYFTKYFRFLNFLILHSSPFNPYLFSCCTASEKIVKSLGFISKTFVLAGVPAI